MSNKKCGSCGGQMDLDEGYWHESYDKDVCSECYNQEIDTCQICGEDAMPSDVSEFILVKVELALTADRPPGIYRILHRPFLSIPLIGSGSMDANDVCFTERLPERDRKYEISGHICKKCARPYARRFTEVYGELTTWKRRMLDNGYGYGWYLQRSHIQRTVAANPAMLYDLEEDQDSWKLKDLFKWCQLPRPTKTWHDWLALEHRGVKVWFTNEWGSYDNCMRWERLALRPEPRYRDMAYNASHDPLIVYPQGLPSMSVALAQCRNEPIERFGYWHQSGQHYERDVSAYELRRAVVLAIDRGAGPWADKGAIRQDGVIA